MPSEADAGEGNSTFYAKLAYASYAADGDEAIKRVADKHGGWHVLDKFSDTFPWVTVLLSDDERQGLVVLRGSKNNTTDRALDRDIMRGAEVSSDRFKRVGRLMRALKERAPHVRWEVVGHSSGGTMAMLLNRRFGVPSHAFNPGATFNSVRILSRLPKYKDNGNGNSNSHIHIVAEDKLSNPVLALARRSGDKVRFHKARGDRPPHSIKNFLPRKAQRRHG